MKNSKPILPIIAAFLAAILLVGWRYYAIRTIQPMPATTNDPIVSAGGPGKDAIPPIDAPRFEKPTAADEYLKDTGEGLDVEMNGQHRFYPFQILVWHEIVNDAFDNVPLEVTYDPLTGTAVAYKSSVSGSPATFTTSGKLWNDNVLMEDRASGSLWAQGTGVAISGPLAGTKLDVYPTHEFAWKDWKKTFPNGDVLTRDTGAERDYTRDPYADYYGTAAVWYPVSSLDPRLSLKTYVFGFGTGDAWTAYPADLLQRQIVVEDTVGSVPVLITFDPNLSVIRAFDRRVGADTLTFSLDDDNGIVDASGSTWSYDGRAIRGSSKGATLTTVELMPSYWFFWAAAHPNTNLYGSTK